MIDIFSMGKNSEEMKSGSEAISTRRAVDSSRRVPKLLLLAAVLPFCILLLGRADAHEASEGQESSEASNTTERRITVYDGGGIIAMAAKYLGTPYKPGGSTPAGFDCSGFTQFVYNQAGYKIPRDTRDQFQSLNQVDEPEVGDLVFFDIEGKRISHVGIYVGDDQFIHSPSSGKVVSYANLEADYWKKRYKGARSIFPLSPP